MTIGQAREELPSPFLSMNREDPTEIYVVFHQRRIQRLSLQALE